MILPLQACDIHVHTEYSHDCATPMNAIKDLTRKRDLMIACTDHNRIGGALAAKALGMKVIPGIEVTTRSLKDILVYFYEMDNLEEFYKDVVEPALDPGKIFGSRTTLEEEELLDALAAYDCVTSLAHPYCPMPKRSAQLPKNVLRRIDAIEVMNFAMSPRSNQKAAELCDRTKKAFTAGSDSHHISVLGKVTMRGYGQTPEEFLAEVAQGHAMVVGNPRTGKDIFKKLQHFVQAR